MIKDKGKKKKEKERKRRQKKEIKEKKELCQFIVTDEKTGKDRKCRNKGVSELYFDKLQCCSYCTTHWKMIIKYGAARFADAALKKDIPKKIAFRNYSQEDYYAVFPNELQENLNNIK